MAKIKNKTLVITDGSEEQNVHSAFIKTKTKQLEVEGFLSVEDALQFCGGISRSTLWHWQKKGLKSYKVGRRCLYRVRDLNKFIYTTDNAKNQGDIKNG